MSKVKFKCGTEVLFTDSITVRRTYSGLMIGTPSEKDNKRYLEMFLGMSEELMNLSKPFIIEPEIKMVDGNPELPEFTCSTSLTHYQPAKDPEQDMSLAVIVWFQNENPLFDGFELRDHALNYNWADVAEDGCW